MLGEWDESVLVWDLRWRRPFFVWETNLLNDLLLVDERQARVERGDVWSWAHSINVSSVHLFLECPVIFPVWYQVARWLGWEFVIPQGLAQQFMSFTGLGGGRELG